RSQTLARNPANGSGRAASRGRRRSETLGGLSVCSAAIRTPGKFLPRSSRKFPRRISHERQAVLYHSVQLNRLVMPCLAEVSGITHPGAEKGPFDSLRPHLVVNIFGRRAEPNPPAHRINACGLSLAMGEVMVLLVFGPNLHRLGNFGFGQ